MELIYKMTEINKRYNYDFIYYLNYLKNNSPNLYNIDIKKIYNKYKHIFYDIKNKDDIMFLNKLFELYFNFNIFPFEKYGHNMPISLYIDKEFLNEYKHISCYHNIHKLMNVNNENKNKYNNMNKVYYYSIIKDNKNKDVMLIKIPMMIEATKEEINNLSNFIIKHKNLDLYIDIRNNSGGNPNCVFDLYKLIINEPLKTKYNNIKCYYRYTKFNKPFIDFMLENGEENIYKYNKKNTNKPFTHYFIQNIPLLNINELCNKNNIKFTGFNGHINIIMNKYNFSSAQLMLDISQSNNRFTIYGDEKSSGFGLYGCAGINSFNKFNIYKLDPSCFILPKTKILCLMDLFYYNYNKYLTIPDKPIPKWMKNI